MRALVLGLVAVLAWTVSAPAHADAAQYYGKNARVVAKDMQCGNSYKPDPSKDYYSGGGCTISGTKVGMATFRGPAQQAEYKALLMGIVKTFYPPGNYYFAQDRGAVVVNNGFTYKVALLGKRRLGATITKIHVN